MRWTLVARSMETGGTQRQIIELARRLPQHGVHVEVVLFYDGGELLSELIASGASVHVLHKRGRYDVARFALALATTVRATRPDAVYSFLFTPNVVMSVLRTSLPGVKLVWGVRASAAEFGSHDRALRASFAASRLLARTASVIICNSEAGRRDHIAAGYPREKTRVVPNGIDTETFVLDRRRGLEWRRRWAAVPGQPVLLVPARLDPMKGHDVLLEAVTRVVARWPGALFVLVGPGSPSQANRIAEIAERYGVADRVVQTGGIATMNDVYNAADVAVLPSRWGEGFPNVVGESMACGVPMIVTDVGDSALIVGGTGEVAQPNDAGSLADAILRGLERWVQAPEELAAGARSRITGMFGVDSMVDRTVDVVREVL